MSNFLTTSSELSDAVEQSRIENERAAEAFWNSLSYENKCNAFYAVLSRLSTAELKDKRSYRGVLYDVFGFDKDMYTRGMDCGFMALHNSIMNEDNCPQDNNKFLEKE